MLKLAHTYAAMLASQPQVPTRTMRNHCFVITLTQWSNNAYVWPGWTSRGEHIESATHIARQWIQPQRSSRAMRVTSIETRFSRASCQDFKLQLGKIATAV